MICFRNLHRNFSKTSIRSADINVLLPHKTKNDIQIVVVGAGLAGLSAASHLINNGFNRTVLLEATDRFGGRINTKQFGDGVCELGAKWIDINTTKDSIYNLLRSANRLQKEIEHKNVPCYVNTKGVNVKRNLSECVEMLYRKLCSGIELDTKYKHGDLHELNNVHAYFQGEANRITKSLFKKEDQGVASDIFTSLFKEFGSLLGCCLEYVNIEHITILNKHNSANAMYIPNGLDNILTEITENIDSSHVKVGKPIGEIRWYGLSSLDQKSVTCLDGSMFLADHIICTLPLGVLKTFSGYMFRPILPKEKLAAIKNLGFGCPVKIYFEYEKNINPWFAANIRPLWSEKERKADLQWTKQLVEISKLPSSSRVLEISVGGACYDEIEKLPDTELLNEVTKLLRTVFKNPKVPFPVSMLRSTWSSSATYLGGRPYFSTLSTAGDVKTLAAPLGDTPSLLFAGDATTLQGFGTIDGARQSGIREADRIINYYKTLS